MSNLHEVRGSRDLTDAEYKAYLYMKKIALHIGNGYLEYLNRVDAEKE